MTATLPFWFRQARELLAPSELPRLTQNIDTDIAIVGGGYTGLWTAIKTKQRDPSKRVVVIEQGLCGQGASGRNGGCMLTFSTKINSLVKLFGAEEAVRLVKASEQAVFDIRDFCFKQGINADVRVDGAIYTATNSSQQIQLLQPLDLLTKYNINHWHQRDAGYVKQRTGSSKNISGIETDAAGSLHPGKLVLGLVQHALSLGIEIFEHTPFVSFTQGKTPVVETPQGKIRCRKLVFAVNAWMGQLFKSFKKHYILVSSDMLITKPMANDLIDIGLNHGMSIADSRIFVHYYRTTADGRLMLGKGGNLFAFNNLMLKAFDRESRVQPMLEKAFADFFPSLKKSFEPSWTGASDRSPTGIPFFGRLNNENNVFYGLGYSGNGVVQTYLGGEILSSLALDIDNEWTRSPLCLGPIGQFPPEPFRYVGANMVKHAVLRKEKAEDLERKPAWFDMQMAKLAAAAGKADK